MEPRRPSKIRLGIEELECRAVPAAPAPIEFPGLASILGEHAQIRNVEGAKSAHDRPFHVKESGAAVFNADGTISGSASGQATHLGAFTLHDTSAIIGSEITPEGHLILQVVSVDSDLVAANGDKLSASFTGIDLTSGQATITFEWTGGDGRFADATGTTTWQISVNPDLTYAAVADGVINY